MLNFSVIKISDLFVVYQKHLLLENGLQVFTFKIVDSRLLVWTQF